MSSDEDWRATERSQIITFHPVAGGALVKAEYVCVCAHTCVIDLLVVGPSMHYHTWMEKWQHLFCTNAAIGSNMSSVYYSLLHCLKEAVIGQTGFTLRVMPPYYLAFMYEPFSFFPIFQMFYFSENLMPKPKTVICVYITCIWREPCELTCTLNSTSKEIWLLHSFWHISTVLRPLSFLLWSIYMWTVWVYHVTSDCNYCSSQFGISGWGYIFLERWLWQSFAFFKEGFLWPWTWVTVTFIHCSVNI